MPSTHGVFRVQPIKPKNLNVNKVRLELLNAQRASGAKDRRLLEQTTQNWKVRPTWVTDISLTGEDAIIWSYIKDAEARQIWEWINGGTEAHWIYPVRARMLRFNSQFRSQSRPNQLRTSAGFSGPPVAYAKAVFNKGIKARRWTVIVIQQRYRGFKTEMNTAVKTGLKKGGWS